MKRPALSKIAASMDVLCRIGVADIAHRSKAVRKSEADELGSDLRHGRDLVSLCAANPQIVRWMSEGVALAPVSAIHSAARQIAEEGGE